MKNKISKRQWQEFEGLVSKLMQESRIPGLSIAVVRDDKVVYQNGFGARNKEKNLAATPNTLYGIGSCTKSFTALGILRLVEQDMLKLDDPVEQYLPIQVAHEEDPITLHHLLSHSSGIPNLGSAETLIRRHCDIGETWVPLADADDLYRFVNEAESEVTKDPGEHYFYFNTGYALLGEIIREVSGMDYPAYIREKFLQPLEMKRSTYLESEYSKSDDTMTPYFQKEEKVEPTVHPFDPFIYAAGGLLSSVEELTHYLKFLLNNGNYNGSSLVSATSLEKLFSIHIDRPQSFYGREGYGYGWGITKDFFNRTMISHGGSTGVSSAHIAFVPDLNIGVATATNVGDGKGALLSQAIFALALGKKPKKVLPQLQIQQKLKQLTGAYASYKNIHKVSVSLKNGILHLKYKDELMEREHPLIPTTDTIDNNQFYIYMMGRQIPVEFEIKENGKVDLLVERNCFHKQVGLESKTSRKHTNAKEK